MYSSNTNRYTEPLQELFQNIKRILEFTEFKDNEWAQKYETQEIRDQAEIWMLAMSNKDNYVTYKRYWSIDLFQEVVHNVRFIDIRYWMEHPYSVPYVYHDHLLSRGRERFLAKYVEKNNYYRMLNGLPDIETPENEFIYLSEPMRNQLHASDLPLHLQSSLIQNNFMGTDEYQMVLQNNPDKSYLKYLGMYKVDIYTARRAKDFEIIRYPLNRADINPNLLNTFALKYSDYREYVMATLYNEQLTQLYPNYRTFMRLLIQAMTLMQISNKCIEGSISHKFLDDSAIHTILSMYNVPDQLLLTDDIRRKLAINLPLLIQNKGTKSIYYEIANILGYDDISFGKLVMMKGQDFNKLESSSELAYDPYFLKVDLQDNDPYNSIITNKCTKYSYKDTISDDITWWDTPDTREILQKSNYTISDSKYITISAEIQQIKYLFESIYFPRLILDNKYFTDQFYINIPEIFGTESVSLYDIMTFLLAASAMNNGISGNIQETNELLAIAGFNFDLDFDSFTEYLNSCKYLDKDRIMLFIRDLTIITPSDITRLFTDVIYPLREWLESCISNADNRQEYLEYEAVYRALFTYDIAKNNFLDDFEKPIEVIRKQNMLSKEDMLMFQYFYPHTMDGHAIMVDQFNISHNETRYRYPFIDYMNKIDWYIPVIVESPDGVDDRGYLYFYDILNSDDIRLLTNPDGTRIFMDYEDNDIGWEINQNAVDAAINAIRNLPDDMMDNAYFQVSTPIIGSNGKFFEERAKLPLTIRSHIFKNILIDKITMDIEGLSEPPTTYKDYLYRKNKKLYDVLCKDNRFERDHQSWMNDVMRIILAVETSLSVHTKYFEQSVVGSELFMKPLITLINRFKSSMVQISKISMVPIFADKVDVGGNSNMIKLFDEIEFTIHFTTMAGKGEKSEFGLYDAESKMIYHITLRDFESVYKYLSGYGFSAQERTTSMGSLCMSDEVKIYKNGKPIDSDEQYAHWLSGDPNTGRWDNDSNFIMKTRESNTNIKHPQYDMNGWKQFVESYIGD